MKNTILIYFTIWLASISYFFPQQKVTIKEKYFDFLGSFQTQWDISILQTLSTQMLWGFIKSLQRKNMKSFHVRWSCRDRYYRSTTGLIATDLDLRYSKLRIESVFSFGAGLKLGSLFSLQKETLCKKSCFPGWQLSVWFQTKPLIIRRWIPSQISLYLWNISHALI